MHEATEVSTLTVVAAAGLMFVTVAAIAQDATIRADSPKDIADGTKSNQARPGQPRIIWRIPEIQPRTWEEQRSYNRSSQELWLFPATETGE